MTTANLLAWARKLLCVAFALCCFGTSHASACVAPSLHTSVFHDFDDLAAGVDAPEIIDVVIAARSDGERHWGGIDRHVQIGQARIRRVLKGSIDGDVIKLRVYPTSCGPYDLQVGASGVVAGRLQRNSEGELELIARHNRPYFR